MYTPKKTSNDIKTKRYTFWLVSHVVDVEKSCFFNEELKIPC